MARIRDLVEEFYQAPPWCRAEIVATGEKELRRFFDGFYAMADGMDEAVEETESRRNTAREERGSTMHPHTNCPHCTADRIGEALRGTPTPATLEDIALFLRDRSGIAHQITAERMLEKFTIYKKG